MDTYQITTTNEVQYIDGINILGAISDYYSKFGYQKIIKIQVCV